MPLALLLPDWLSTDSSKVLFLIFVCGVLFVVSRLLSRYSTSDANQIPSGLGDAASLSRAETTAGNAALPVHPVMRFGDIELRKFYFNDFDALTGPPDPFEFASELTLEIEHLESGNRSTWEFTVGTPAGFARLLENSNWESFYSPQIFVIRKFELEMLREMILDHIRQELDMKRESARNARTDTPSSYQA